MSQLSYRLILYRWVNELSIKQLAKKVDVYYGCIMNAEIGKVKFQKKTIKKINDFIEQTSIIQFKKANKN